MPVCADIAMALSTEDLGYVLLRGSESLIPGGACLLKMALPRKVRRKCPSMYETMDVLKHLPANVCSEELLIPEVLRLNITEDDMEKEHR